MNNEEQKEFEEFLKWKKEKNNQVDNENAAQLQSDEVKRNDVKKKDSSSCMGKGLSYGCLGIIVLFVLLAVYGSYLNDEQNKKVDWSEASVMSEYFIKGFMKYPDDVSFIKESKNVNEEGNGTFKITGRLKANNTFGQAVPYTYNIRIKYNGGDWSIKSNWSIVGGNLYNEGTQEFTEF